MHNSNNYCTLTAKKFTAMQVKPGLLSGPSNIAV